MADRVGEAWMWSVRVRVAEDVGSEDRLRAWESFMRRRTRREVFAVSRSED